MIRCAGIALLILSLASGLIASISCRGLSTGNVGTYIPVTPTQVTYAPANTANWSPQPATVQDALDGLAAAIQDAGLHLP